MWTGARSWAVPCAILLVAAVVIGLRTGDDDAGRITLAILAAADARCPEAIDVWRQHPRVRDGAATLDGWAWRRALELWDGRDRCRHEAEFARRLTRGVMLPGMPGGAILPA